MSKPDLSSVDWANITTEEFQALAREMQPRRKIADEDTWARVRRGWEQGETAASLALRFDVGLANLWRRRAAEGWERRPPEGREPEPLEGWNAFAQRRLDDFQELLRTERETAEALAGFMAGGPLEDAVLWHLGFLLHWRADRLGPETAEADRARHQGAKWAEVVWDEDGRLRPLHRIDHGLMQFARDDWRAWAGLPDGAARGWP